MFALDKTTVIPEVNLHSKQSLTVKRDAHIQTTHIDREKIKDSPVVNLSELLSQEQSIVRVTNNSIDSNQSGLSIRGFGDNAAANSLILVDGFPLTNVSLLAPNFNSIALADIERIDIIQGSQGSLWGDQAVGGVVNIVTRHPEKFIANVNLGLGSFNHYFYNLLAGSKFSNGLFFKAFGFANKTDNYRVHNRQNNESIFLQTGWDYARGTIHLNFQSSNNSALFPGSLTQLQFNDNPRQATNLKNFNHYQTQILQLLNKHEINSDWILETRLSFQKVNGHGVMAAAFHPREWESVLHPRLIGKILNNKVTAGYVGQHTQYHFMNVIENQHDRTMQNNIYGQVVFPLSSMVDLTLGARSAWQDNKVESVIGFPYRSVNRVFVTEQGVSFHPSNEWQFFLRRDGNFRFPKANEALWTPPDVNALKPQTGVSYEAGAIWRTGQQKAQLNIYRLQLKNEIAFDPTETIAQPLGNYQNFSPTWREGITLTETFKLTPRFILDSQLNYVNARFASGPFSGNTIPAVPAYTANAGISYAFIDNWRAKYSALYTGSYYPSLDVENVSKKQAGYWVNTAAVQYIHKSFDISFEVGNVFNQRYATYTIYDAFRQSNLFYPGAGRNYLLTFKTSIE